MTLSFKLCHVDVNLSVQYLFLFYYTVTFLIFALSQIRLAIGRTLSRVRDPMR
jgi:hypothetical protein